MSGLVRSIQYTCVHYTRLFYIQRLVKTHTRIWVQFMKRRKNEMKKETCTCDLCHFSLLRSCLPWRVLWVFSSVQKELCWSYFHSYEVRRIANDDVRIAQTFFSILQRTTGKALKMTRLFWQVHDSGFGSYYWPSYGRGWEPVPAVRWYGASGPRVHRVLRQTERIRHLQRSLRGLYGMQIQLGSGEESR